MKKNLVVVFGISENYTFALANVLIGMKKHCKVFWDDIIVYHDNVSLENQKKLNNILKCKFIDFNELASKITVSETVKKEYSLLTFARFECFNLLNEYKNVIWHDVDILIQKDFSGLQNYGQKSGLAATISVDNFFVESNFNKLILNYNMFVPLFNAGVLCLSDKLKNYKIMTKWCYDTTTKYSDAIRFADQGIINLLIQEFKIDVEPIDILKYCCHPLKAEAVDASIIHAYGSDKFWNYEPYIKKFPEWEENNFQWNQIIKQEENISLSKNSNPLVSVVMSVYTRYNYLKASIESILNQTYKNFELIIVVEKSEKQREIVQYLKEFSDSRIKIILNKKKLGFSASLNEGIKKSEGKYIVRMDDDDISLENRINVEVNYMESHPSVGIAGSWMQMFMKCDDICKKPLENNELKVLCLIDNPFFHPTVIMRKDEILKYDLFYDLNYFTEDYELWVRASKYVKFANINEILLKYRASGENATVQSSSKVHKSVISIMKRQFKENLKLDLTENELELIYGNTTQLFQYLFNRDEASKLLDDVIEKILKANLKNKYYDHEILEKILRKNKIVKINKKNSLVKKLLKKLFKPIYKRLMVRIENIIDRKILENNTFFDYKIEKINEKNDEI